MFVPVHVGIANDTLDVDHRLPSVEGDVHMTFAKVFDFFDPLPLVTVTLEPMCSAQDQIANFFRSYPERFDR